MNFGVKLDRNANNKLKECKDGSFRFSLRIKNDQDVVVLTIAGFRYLPGVSRIVAPVATMRWGALSIIQLEPEFERAITEKVKGVVDKEEASTDDYTSNASLAPSPATP